MPKSIKKFNPAKLSNPQKAVAIIVVMVLAVVGSYVLFSSKALSVYVSAEAEGGVLTSPAVINADSNASDGHYVQFGAVPVVKNPNVVFGLYEDGQVYSNLTSFTTTTGITPKIMEVYMDGGSGLNGIADSNYGWTGVAGTGVRLLIGMGVCNGNFASPVGDLADGAAGSYNSYWQAFGTEMVKEGFGNAIIRVGVELGGNWNACSITNSTDAANYAAYFRQIVNTLRSVPGQSFQYDWELADPATGSFPGTYTAAEAYPGDNYVDYIGNDTYDQSWDNSCGLSYNNSATIAQSNCVWNNDTLPELNLVDSFALAHNKQIAFPEWGVIDRSDGHGLGDDPTFINNMAAWMNNKANNVGFDVYFNAHPANLDSEITDGNFQASLHALENDF